MSRRKFLKGSAALLGAPIVAGSSARLYGAPASVLPREVPDFDKFKLPLSRAGVPFELWDSLAKVSNLWENVLTSQGEAARFFGNTSEYMNSMGLDGSDATLADESVRMLLAMTDPRVKACLEVGDYHSLFRCLASLNLLEQRDPSILEGRITAVFLENEEAIRKAIEEVGAEGAVHFSLEDLQQSGLFATEEDLLALSGILGSAMTGVDRQPMCSAVAVCALAVAIAATVAAYVSVAVAATVVLLVAVSVSAAVTLAVTATGGGFCGRYDTCIQPDGVSPPFKGDYARLDPAVIRNFDRAMRFSVLSRDGNIQIAAIRELISAEISAVFRGMKRAALVDISEENMPNVVTAVTRYSLRVLGVPEAAEIAL